MGNALRVGKWFGIDVCIDWTWSAVFVLMSWNLTHVFHVAHPTWTLGATVLLAVVAALLFFASLLAHEFAHALVARRFGLAVRDLRLFMFGGVSNIEREPSSPRAEFWIALVGPLASFALGTIFIVAGGRFAPPLDPGTTDPLARLDPMPTLLFWLGPVNLLVGMFNLIPGLPLDGGRILRAALWKLTGDVYKATLAAATVGRAVGFFFVVIGIAIILGARIAFFGQGPAAGTWIALIGWFLNSAATRASMQPIEPPAPGGKKVVALIDEFQRP